ncbi:MAG: DUF6272 family protein [Magnetovibrionaceae bacterium]
MMAEFRGPYRPLDDKAALESLALRFSPSLVPLKERWKNNGLSADFLADYVTTFFPGDDQEPDSLRLQADVKAAVNFIANELLENAMKYSCTERGYNICIQLLLEEDGIFFQLTNSMIRARAEQFRGFVDELISTDLEELYVRSLEGGFGELEGAGLGFVTMINDYGAELAWSFHEAANDIVTVETQVRVAF